MESIRNFKSKQSTETPSDSKATPEGNPASFSRQVLLHPSPSNTYFEQAAFRLPILHSDQNEGSAALLQEIIHERKESEDWLYFIDNEKLLKKNGVSINPLEIYGGLESKKDWDAILRNVHYFKKEGIDLNLQNVVSGLLEVQDWDSILNHRTQLKEEGFDFSVNEISNGLINKEYWYSILKNHDEFHTAGIEIPHEQILEGLIRKDDWNTILTHYKVFQEYSAFDINRIRDGLLKNEEINLIIENIELFSQDRASEVRNLALYLEEKGKYQALLDHLAIFTEAGVEVDLEKIYAHALKEEDKKLLSSHAFVFLAHKEGIESSISTIILDEMNLNSAYLQQRYDLLFLLEKQGLISISKTDREAIFDSLKLDRRTNLLDRIDMTRTGDFSISNPEKPISDVSEEGNESYSYPVDINSTIINFYAKQLLRQEFKKIKSTTDSSHKLSLPQLVYMLDLETNTRHENQKIWNLLREHLLFIVHDRVRRSRLENSLLVPFPAYRFLTHNNESGQVLEFLAACMGLFAERNIPTPWIKVAEAAYTIWKMEEPSETLIDYVFSLEHNNGSVFNRGHLVKNNDETCKKILDTKRDATSFDDFLNRLDDQNLPAPETQGASSILSSAKNRVGIV